MLYDLWSRGLHSVTLAAIGYYFENLVQAVITVDHALNKTFSSQAVTLPVL